jgi:hypothetical protein
MVVHEARPDVGIYYRDQPAKEHRQRRVAIDNDFQLADNLAQAIDHGRETIMGIDASCEIFNTIEAALTSCRSAQPVEVAHVAQEPT